MAVGQPAQVSALIPLEAECAGGGQRSLPPLDVYVGFLAKRQQFRGAVRVEVAERPRVFVLRGMVSRPGLAVTDLLPVLIEPL